MSRGHRIPYRIAVRLARHLQSLLADSCERIEVVGSIRRQRETIGDLELICIPKYSSDLFGQPCTSELDELLTQLKDRGSLIKGRAEGDKYKNYRLGGEAHEGFNLDLFIANHETWGVSCAIRTGDLDFSKALVTPRMKRGLLPDNLCVENNRVWRCERDDEGRVRNKSDKPLETPRERDFLELTCGGEVPAGQRDQYMAQTIYNQLERSEVRG